MAWTRGSQGVSPKKVRSRPHKTKKRLAAKRVMLATKAEKRRKRK